MSRRNIQIGQWWKERSVSYSEAWTLVGDKKKKKVRGKCIPWTSLEASRQAKSQVVQDPVRLAIFRFYLSFKNVTENLLISSLKSSLHWPDIGKYASMFSPHFKIYLLFYSNHSYYIPIIYTLEFQNINNLYLYSWEACSLIEGVRNVLHFTSYLWVLEEVVSFH